MQATIRSGINTIRRHLSSGVPVLDVLMVAVTIFSITALVLLLRPPTQPAGAVIETSAQPALSEQRIAEWTEIYVTQLAERRPVLPSRPASLAALEIASQDVLNAQRIAEWTEYNVTQLAEQGSGLANRTSARDAVDAAARQALIEQSIATWTELYVTQPATQGH
jgi:hypothetical protein